MGVCVFVKCVFIHMYAHVENNRNIFNANDERGIQHGFKQGKELIEQQEI